MPLYRWQGMSVDGKKCKGALEATSGQMLQGLLLGQGIALIAWREASPGWRYVQSWLYRSPSAYECHQLFAQLGSFLQAGIALKQALQTLASVQQNQILRRDLHVMAGALDQGHSLAMVLQGYDYVPAYVQPLIQTSEETGTLGAALDTISAMTLADSEYEKTMRNACLGPLMTIVVALIIMGVITVVLMPQFQQLYVQCKVQPPALVALGASIAAFFTPKKLIAGLSMALGLLVCLKIMRKQLSLIPLLAGLPGLRRALFNADILRWLTIMHAYASNGLPIVEACKVMGRSTHNPEAKKLIQDSIMALEEGRRLSDGFARMQHHKAMALVCPLLSIGEESGDLVPMLVKAKQELAGIIQQQAHLFTTLIGPILTIVTGLLIGGLLLMLYLPIMQLGSLIKF